MRKLLPQANTLDTVIKTFLYASNKDSCELQDVANFCDFDIRQASYYTNACFYLGLLDENLKPTLIGKEIISNTTDILSPIYELILSDELINRIFIKLLFSNREQTLQYAIKEINILYPEYSEAVVNRRAHCLLGWCVDIFNYLRNHISNS